MFMIYNKLKGFLNKGVTETSLHGKVFSPLYNYDAKIELDMPELFNASGERMDVFFLRDINTAHHPYKYGSVPTKFLWDRYNFGLKTHFYSHNAMLETMGNPDRKFGSFIETRSIVPRDYEIFKKNPMLGKEFEAIFTYDSGILNSVDNAKFVPWAAQPWFGTELGGGTVDCRAYEKKSKNVSFICSKKIMCELHKFRYDLACKMKASGKVDTFGTFDGGPYVPFIADTLTDYRFSVCIENEIQEYYFSERLTSCFLSMTVPVYYGATKIGDFFNIDGIIQISPETDFNKLLDSLNKENYETRKNAVIDNFNRVQKYLNIADFVYNEYLTRT